MKVLAPLRKVLFPFLFGCFFQGLLFAQQDFFHNPLLPSGADPYSFFYKGYYYYTHTTGRNITLWKTSSIARLATAEKKIIFQPPVSGPYSKELWAPEIHRIQGKWYLYFSADSGSNSGHRLWVLENSADDPLQGKWILKGKLTTPGDRWSIDASVFTLRGQLYCIWSGWEADHNGQQNIYIARMRNPWTITGPRVLLSQPELPWELHGDLHSATDPPHVSVYEGPAFLLHGDKM
ncbi:MAG TPA: glycoside hydrolase family 43 protein, partial [Sediminibacterium sp.]|nr:glycoside hydrolase family 43 protein [Sediminibacterium sp.]